MQVFQFQKSFLERLEESLNVLSWKEFHIPASQVKFEWACYIELQIEPSGWQALWKIPRNVCGKYKIRYPSIVFGSVEHINFQDLNAIYNITAVQDENIHLPERHEVALEDLWPTISQDNTELNIERTADCLDRLRFFYTQVWLPWDNDNDDDFNWVEKHLHSRIKLCFDLRQRNVSRPIASLIHSFKDEAKYIQQRRECFEIDIFEEESDICNEKNSTKERITQLMLMHFRLTMIRSHFEMLENPDMRPIYEEMKFKATKCTTYDSVGNEEKDSSCFVIFLPSTISHQIELLKSVEKLLPKNSSILFNHSLQDVLDTYKHGDTIFLSTGCHVVHFIQHFYSSGHLCGIKFGNEHVVRINSSVNNSSFFIFDGDFTLENIEFDCRNILSGIVVKHGNLTIKNCKLIGNGKSSIQQAIICNANASILMENCILDNFETGILLNKNSSLILKDSSITNCNIGIEISKHSNIKCYQSSFINCHSYGIYVKGLSLEKFEKNFIILKHLTDFEKYSIENLQVSDDCFFESCSNNVCISNDNKCVVSQQTFDYMENVF